MFFHVCASVRACVCTPMCLCECMYVDKSVSQAVLYISLPTAFFLRELTWPLLWPAVFSVAGITSSVQLISYSHQSPGNRPTRIMSENYAPVSVRTHTHTHMNIGPSRCIPTTIVYKYIPELRTPLYKGFFSSQVPLSLMFQPLN